MPALSVTNYGDTPGLDSGGRIAQKQQIFNKKHAKNEKLVYTARLAARPSTTMNKNRILLVMLFSAPLMNLGLDLYTPSLPAIAHAFNATHYAVQLSLLAYIIAFGVVQPFIGPLSDRYGRKVLTRLSVIIYIGAALGAAKSTSIEMLIAFRVFQGISATMLAAMVKAIFLDTFKGKELAKANNYYSIGWSLTPMLAPVLGGYLQHLFDWEAGFYFIAAYAAIAALCFFLFLPETLSKSNDHPRTPWYRAWGIIFSDKIFMSGIAILVIEFSIVMIYYAYAPFIIQLELHFNPAQYGEILLAIGLACFVGNAINRFALSFFGLHKIIGFGLIMSFLTAMGMMLLGFIMPLNIYLITVPVFFLFFFNGIIFSNTMTLCLARYKQFSATAGSLLGGLISLGTAAITLFVNLIHLHSVGFIGAAYAIIIGAGLVLFLRVFRYGTLEVA